MGQQVKALKEANLALQAELEEAKDDLACVEKSVTSLVQSATEAKSGETTKEETQDPPTAQENQGQDYVRPTKAADPPVEAGVPGVGEVQATTGAKVAKKVDEARQEE
ncbi:hypothetical protein LWI29_027907 [Acer saccharum]|uniref:Uncharacterized protein n=1 Tax=Acer saccharum TaxID=4024 RepID=A0AA39S9B6_ACESA|nr:hypothetical protein LWI29_027907 [Acer saccharum]